MYRGFARVHGELYMCAGDANDGFDVGIMQLKRSVSPPVAPIALNKEPNDKLNLPMKDVPPGDTLTFIGYGAQVRSKPHSSFLSYNKLSVRLH